MQGRSRVERELLDAESMVGELVPPGGVYAFLADHGGRARPALFPPAQATELRVQRDHVGQRGRAGAGQPVDVYRTQHRTLLDLRMLAVPRLDLEPVGQPPPEVGDDAGVRRRAQVTVPFQAAQQHVEAVAEVAGAKSERPVSRIASAISCSPVG